MGRSSRHSRGGPIGSLLSWVPLAVSVCLFYQVYDLGLRAAIAEEQRLIEAESELQARYAHAEAMSDELEQLLRAQADPVYLERERRKLLSPTPLANPAD